MLEREIQKQCLKCMHMKGIYCWRNNTAGIYNKKSGGYFFHGLAGVSDILGILPQECSHGLQGVFIAVEVKTPKGIVSDAQRAFLGQIEARGGLALVVHSVDELEQRLQDFL